METEGGGQNKWNAQGGVLGVGTLIKREFQWGRNAKGGRKGAATRREE